MQWEISRIVEEKTIHLGHLLYFIKWKGYSHEFNTWERAEGIPQAIIDEWNLNRGIHQ